MKINRFISVVLFIVCQISFGQTILEKQLHGKIRVDFAAVNGINVLNLMSGKMAVIGIEKGFYIL